MMYREAVAVERELLAIRERWARVLEHLRRGDTRGEIYATAAEALARIDNALVPYTAQTMTGLLDRPIDPAQPSGMDHAAALTTTWRIRERRLTL